MTGSNIQPKQMIEQGLWILERCTDERFPYRLQILKGQQPWLVVRTQNRWPAAGKDIFCLREKEPPGPDDVLNEIERVPVVAFHERGRRVSVILDRKRYRRCDFLFLTKSYKRHPGQSYEQIFWLTQGSIARHRPAAKLVVPRGAEGITIRIASNEHYPWSFPGARVERGPLVVGDYALVDGNDILAVVERKTMENLLGDFGMMPVLHQRLAELCVYEYHTLVVEAPYADFLNPKKVQYYSPSFCARAIAELHALHPKLHIVFFANRKLANEWTRHYFAAVWELTRAKTLT